MRMHHSRGGINCIYSSLHVLKDSISSECNRATSHLVKIERKWLPDLNTSKTLGPHIVVAVSIRLFPVAVIGAGQNRSPSKRPRTAALGLFRGQYRTGLGINRRNNWATSHLFRTVLTKCEAQSSIQQSGMLVAEAENR